jgi:exopolysaccharide production protein ExoZ
MLFNIQVLRAIASVLVVHAHAAGPAGFGLSWDGGANGVDLFFVISGFIIAYVASIDSDQFVKRRLIRIVPIYWSSTLVLFVLVLVLPSLFRTTSADPELLVRSLLFLPHGDFVHSDGIPHPTLSGGWTLNYEMYFYMVFAIALAISSRWATTIAVAMLLAAITIINATGLSSSPVAKFYGEPIIFEFGFGIAAFHVMRAVEAMVKRNAKWKPPKLVLYLAVIAGLACIAFTKELFDGVPRWISTGIPSFFTVLGAVLLERVHDVKVTNKVAVMVGDASYVLYLIHAYVVYGIIRIVLRNQHFGEVTGQLMVVLLMVISCVAAVAIYRWYEQPILRVLKRWLIRPRPRPVAAASAVVAPPA